MKKIKEKLGWFFASAILGSMAGGTVHFKRAELILTLMMGSAFFVLFAGLGLWITNHKEETKK